MRTLYIVSVSQSHLRTRLSPTEESLGHSGDVTGINPSGPPEKGEGAWEREFELARQQVLWSMERERRREAGEYIERSSSGQKRSANYRYQSLNRTGRLRRVIHKKFHSVGLKIKSSSRRPPRTYGRPVR